jgi:glycerol-1-phosphatase
MGSLAEIYDGFIVDLDGVVHVGWQPIPGAVEALSSLIGAGKGVAFLTNDPRYARTTVAARLRAWGLPIDLDSVVTAGWFAAATVAAGPGAVYVIGSAELRAEVEAAGATVVPAAEAGRARQILVAGHSGFDYAELLAACRAGDNGAELFATNRDATFPMPDGRWPGTGAVLAAVETALGRRAHSLGKPEPAIFEVARRRLGPGRVAVVGDRIPTDIAGGKRAGLATILVLGEAGPPPDTVTPYPDHVLRDLAGLLTRS